jgi:hypothetical protein
MWNKGLIAVVAALTLALLSGCGSSQPNGTAAQQTQGTDNNGQGNGQGGPGAFNGQRPDLVGKVKTVNGNTITVFKSSFQRGRGGQGGQGSQGGQGGQGRPNMQNMFSEETEDINVTDSTKIVKREFVNNQMTETPIALADLKADDILSITLVKGTQDADTISLGNGGFGGGRRGQNQGQNTGASQ